jgi:hypothetical protein
MCEVSTDEVDAQIESEYSIYAMNPSAIIYYPDDCNRDGQSDLVRLLPSGANRLFCSKSMPSPFDRPIGTMQEDRDYEHQCCMGNLYSGRHGLRIHQRGLSPITLFHSSYAPGPIYHRFPSVFRSPHSRVQVFIVRRFLPHAHTPNCDDNIARSLSSCDRSENDSIVVMPMLIN